MRVLKETILRITSRHREERLTTSKLVNIVFLCDVNTFDKYSQKITEAIYRKTSYGISSEDIKEALGELTDYISFTHSENGMVEPELHFYGEYNDWTLTKRALRCIDEVINVVKTSSCGQLSEVVSDHSFVESTELGGEVGFSKPLLAKDYNDWETQL